MDNLILKDITSVVPRHTRRLEERVTKLLKRLQWRALRSALVWFVFQLQLLFSVYQSSSTILRCEHWWVPLSLSLLISIIYLIILSDNTIHYLHKEAILSRIAATRSHGSARRTAHIGCAVVLAALTFASAVVTAWSSRSVLCSP